MKRHAEAAAGALAAAGARLRCRSVATAALRALPRAQAHRVLGPVAELRLNPMQIAGETRIGAPAKRLLVAGGDWDLAAEPIEATATHRLMEMLIQYRGRYAESAVYKEMAGRIAARGRLKTNIELRSLEELNAYMASRLALIEELETGRLHAAVADPVGVALGRSGRVLRCGDGRHRLSAARLLGLTEVTVRVEHLHPELVAAAARRGGRLPQALQAEISEHTQAQLTPPTAGELLGE